MESERTQDSGLVLLDQFNAPKITEMRSISILQSSDGRIHSRGNTYQLEVSPQGHQRICCEDFRIPELGHKPVHLVFGPSMASSNSDRHPGTVKGEKTIPLCTGTDNWESLLVNCLLQECGLWKWYGICILAHVRIRSASKIAANF